MKLELISVVANPKGGNRTLRVRIRGRCIFHVFSTSNEKLLSNKILCFQWNWSLSPLWRNRREETERCESESGVYVFLTFSRHLMKNLFLIKCCLRWNWSLSPLWRTRREETERCESESGVDVFLTFSWHLMKNLFLINCCVFNGTRAYPVSYTHLTLPTICSV